MIKDIVDLYPYDPHRIEGNLPPKQCQRPQNPYFLTYIGVEIRMGVVHRTITAISLTNSTHFFANSERLLRDLGKEEFDDLQGADNEGRLTFE